YSAQPVSIDAGHIALLPFLSNGRSSIALFTDIRGPLERIIGGGDTLDGKTIYNLFMGPDALSGSSIAFWATFTDGSQGIYLASVPEPASLTACALLCLFWPARHIKVKAALSSQLPLPPATACH